ncbi:50S ribosomal protein L22 [bacterium]|nr:50S ribosomal protein L22 [bacterium]
MEAVGRARFIRMSPKKLKIVADTIRGKRVEDVLGILPLVNKKGARILFKVVKQAAANALNIEGLKAKEEELFIKDVKIDGGPSYKRVRIGSFGRGSRILKRTSHITVIVSDEK